MELSYRRDPGRDAVEHQPYFGIGVRPARLAGRPRLHAHEPTQKGQAVGDPVIGFRDEIGVEGRADSIHGGPSFLATG